MAQLTTLFWRDIPAQVIAKRGRTRAKVLLEARFQEAIDRAAMRARKTTSNAYLEDWRQETVPCGDDIDVVAREAAQGLVQEYPESALEQLIRAQGFVANCN